MKSITLLGSKNTEGKNDIREITRQIGGSVDGAVLSEVYLEDLLFEISNDQVRVIDATTGNDLADTDLVMAFNWYKSGSKSLYKDVAFAAALYLESRGTQFWNSEMLTQRSTSKLSATTQLALLGLPVPKTRFSLSTEHLLGQNIETPFILKSVAASRGASNYLCRSAEEASQHLSESLEFNRFMIQAYLPNNSDLRIICFGGQPQMVIERRRSSDSTHLNNTSQGGQADLLPLESLSPRIIDECKKICNSMGREMAGIDLLPSSENPEIYVYLEVNAIPQLTSGTFIEEKMAALAAVLGNMKEQS